MLERLSVDEWEARWRRRLEEGASIWVAVDEESVIGFAAVGPSRTEEDDVAELYAIYMRPESWGSNAAHELMAAAIGWFLEEQYAAAMLWVLADNPRARRFYEREGWRFEGTRVDVILDTEVEVALYRLTLVGG